MAYNPNEPRDKGGKWTTGGGGYGKGQTLKGTYKGPSNNNRPNVGQLPGSIDTVKRFGRMNSTSKAQLTSKASFKTKLAGPSKKSKGKAVGTVPAKVVGDQRLVSHYYSNTVEKKKGGGSFQQHSNTSISKEVRSQPKELNLFAREESSAAVAIQTAKALDRDFHHAKKKADVESMKAAVAKSQVPVIKYPQTKPKAKDHPKTYIKTKR